MHFCECTLHSPYIYIYIMYTRYEKLQYICAVILRSLRSLGVCYALSTLTVLWPLARRVFVNSICSAFAVFM